MPHCHKLMCKTSKGATPKSWKYNGKGSKGEIEEKNQFAWGCTGIKWQNHNPGNRYLSLKKLMGIKAQREILHVYLFQWELGAHMAVASYILLVLKYLQKSVLILCWGSIFCFSSGHMKDSFIPRRADTEMGSTIWLISSHLRQNCHPIHHFG